MQEIKYNTVLRLAENLTKITEEEFQLLEKINNEDSWNNLDDLERLVEDYINKDTKVLKVSTFQYVNMVLRKEIDEWLDENEKADIINTVMENLEDYEDIQSFTDYENNKAYTIIYNNFDISTVI